MNSEKCIKTEQNCRECGEFVIACAEHDEYYVCDECGCRMPIEKARLKATFDLLFKKIYGAKPDKPGNN